MASTPPTVPTSAPTNKAIAATGASAFGAAVATLVLYFIDPAGTALPAEVKAAITTIVTGAVTLAAAYFTPPGVSEAVVMDAAGKVRVARAAMPVPPPPGK